MPAKGLQSLDFNTPIVRSNGAATQYFLTLVRSHAKLPETLEEIIDAWNITAGVGLSGGGNLLSDVTIDLEDTPVSPGSYTNANITVDAQGRLVAASSGIAPTGGDEFNEVCDVTTAAGMPLTTDRITGHLKLADPSFKPTAFVAGLAKAATTATLMATCTRGKLTLADWTAVTGSAALLPGQPYFLAAGGGLTTVPPSAPNCVTVVGVAADTTTMLIEPEPPVQL